MTDYIDTDSMRIAGDTFKRAIEAILCKRFKYFFNKIREEATNPEWIVNLNKGKEVMIHLSKHNRLGLFKGFKKMGFIDFKDPISDDPIHDWLGVCLKPKGALALGIKVTDNMLIGLPSNPPEDEEALRGEIMWVKT